MFVPDPTFDDRVCRVDANCVRAQQVDNEEEFRYDNNDVLGWKHLCNQWRGVTSICEVTQVAKCDEDEA